MNGSKERNGYVTRRCLYVISSWNWSMFDFYYFLHRTNRFWIVYIYIEDDPLVTTKV